MPEKRLRMVLGVNERVLGILEEVFKVFHVSLRWDCYF